MHIKFGRETSKVEFSWEKKVNMGRGAILKLTLEKLGVNI
jgi:hypothetical protein